MARKYKRSSDSKLSDIIRHLRKKKHLRHLLYFIIASIILVFFASGPRGTYQLVRFLEQKKNLEKEIKELDQDKKGLQELKNKLENDPEYIEKVAREKYKMKKEGEQVYQVVEDK
jgi:cell division protein FtsB